MLEGGTTFLVEALAEPEPYHCSLWGVVWGLSRNMRVTQGLCMELGLGVPARGPSEEFYQAFLGCNTLEPLCKPIQSLWIPLQDS